MYNIKLKSVPNKAKTGSQLDYSLVDRNTLFLKPNTPVDSDVKNTMGAVPRDKANIEAEGGETVIGDINNDGFLEHQTIVGKRHTQGGVPLNVPEGSFIFSDTKKMIIKDPEVLAIFGMKPNKKGYTPAEIAKKYNINDYIAILKDPAKDKYSKETAQIMLESNLKKLGMLALIQESMKGFPDGVPAIAESVMGQMQGGQEQQDPEEEVQETPEEQGPQEEMMEKQPMQRYGGQLNKAQFGKQTNIPSWANVAPNTSSKKLNKGKKTVTKSEDGYTGYWDRVGHNIGRVLGTGDIEKGSWTRPNDPRMIEAAYKLNPFSSYYNGEGFFGGAMDYLGNLVSAPQKEMNHILTGLYETPMTTAQRYDDYSYGTRFAGDVVTDPLIMDFAAKAAAKAVGKKAIPAAKYIGKQTVKGAKYLGKQIAPIVHKVVEKVEPAIKYTKELWDKIPIEKKALILEKLSQASAHGETAGQKPVPIKDLSHRAYLEKLNDAQKYQKNTGINSNDLIAPAPINNISSDTISISPNTQTIKYYNPRLPKPEDTDSVKWLPAQNSAELNNTINQKTPAVIDASQKAAAVRNVSEKAQEDAQTVNAQNAAAQQSDKPVYKVRIKTPPVNTQPEIPVERTEPGYKYGGNTHMYQNAGTTTEPQNTNTPPKKVVKYFAGTTPENKGKIFAKYEDGTIGQNDITNYLKWDPTVVTKTGKKGAMRLELPQNLPFKEKQRLANLITQTGFGDQPEIKGNVNSLEHQKVLQSSNAHINPKDYYQGFYSGLTPQDFEDKIVRENFGDDKADSMSEVAKRREAFKILGVHADDTELMDAKKLYTPEFINNTFYPAFKKLLPADVYRSEMGNDAMFGLEHLDAYKIPKKDKPAEDTNTAKVDKPYIKPNFRDNGWWLQDRVNFAGTLTDPVHAYFPAMSHHDYMTPGYVLNDPTTQIRAMQQGTGALINQGFNSMSGNVAMAAASGINGQGIDKAAEIAGNVNNSNVGIVNNAASRNAEIMNRGIDQNENDKQVYMGNVSRTLENLDKANNFKKWRTIAAYNNGVTNWQKKNEYEQMFKNVTIDPITGRRYIHGNDEAELNDDGTFAYNTYVNPWTAGSGVAAVDPDSLYKQYRKNMTHQEAVDMVNLHIRNSAANRASRSAAGASGYGYGSTGAASPYAYGATAGSAYGYDELEG